jgi:hypothetical protein
MSNTDFEADVNLAPFGISLANDPQTGEVLVNVERAETFDDSVSREVEGLLFLGKLTHDCEIFGHTFLLRTLTRGERIAISLFVQDHENTLGLADALQTAYLALALVLVDGRPLTISLETETAEVRLRRNYDIIKNWFDPVLEALYAEYKILIQKQLVAFQELEGK